MAITVEVRDATGRAYKFSDFQRFVSAGGFSKKFSEIPKRTYNKLTPGVKSTIQANVVNRVRNAWKRNYDEKTFWSRKTNTRSRSSRKYLYWKALQVRHVDIFEIGSLGVFPAIYGPSVYGKRTGATYNFITGAEGSDVELVTRVGGGEGARRFDLGIRMSINESRFEGPNVHYRMYKKQGARGRAAYVGFKKKTKNQLLDFIRQINPNDPSVLVRLTSSQLDSIRVWIWEKYRILVRDVISLEVMKIGKR